MRRDKKTRQWQQVPNAEHVKQSFVAVGKLQIFTFLAVRLLLFGCLHRIFDKHSLTAKPQATRYANKQPAGKPEHYRFVNNQRGRQLAKRGGQKCSYFQNG